MKKINVLLSSCAVLILPSCFGSSAMKSTSKVIEPTMNISQNALPPIQEIPTQSSDGVDSVNTNGSEPSLAQPSKNPPPPPPGGSGSTMYPPSTPVFVKDDILLRNTSLINNQITNALNNCNMVLNDYKNRYAALIASQNLCQKMMVWVIYNLFIQRRVIINRQGSYLNGGLLAINDSTSQNKTLCYAIENTNDVIVLEQVEDCYGCDKPEYCFATLSYPTTAEKEHSVDCASIHVSSFSPSLPGLMYPPHLYNQSSSISMISEEEKADKEEDDGDSAYHSSNRRFCIESPLVSSSDSLELIEDKCLKKRPGRLRPIKNFCRRSHRVAAQSPDPTDKPKKYKKNKKKGLRLFQACISKQ